MTHLAPLLHAGGRFRLNAVAALVSALMTWSCAESAETDTPADTGQAQDSGSEVDSSPPSDAAADGDSAQDSGGPGDADDGGEAPAFPPSGEAESALRAELDAAREASGALGAVVAVASADAVWTHASGNNGLGNAAPPLTPASRLHFGAIGMSITALAALSLAEQGALDLDAPAAEAWPALSGIDEITLRHLLSHTSGIADYYAHPTFAEQLSTAHTPDELAAFGVSLPRLSSPGKDFHLSRTNTVLLGRAIERAANKSLEEVVKEITLLPLGMNQTFDSIAAVPGGYAAGYAEVGGELVEVTTLVHPTNAWASGSFVGTVPNLAQVGRVGWAGAYLAEPLRAEMLSPAKLASGAASFYGLGCAITGEGPTLVYSHRGDAPGYRAWVAHYPDRGLTLAVAINLESWEALDAIAQALISELDLPSP
jgi:D-alanyl-D-alanine carboxypeptidase